MTRLPTNVPKANINQLSAARTNQIKSEAALWNNLSIRLEYVQIIS